ncbi:hypothetical protein Poli38472_010403 [Pythium oligandrum]|uniref:Uncharacterized protein n=1 Tax=Pythium oligandrum TaxID=41045 RepID=A0A8K1C2Z1_PYTOL|nr:hypothetical protein Poli38472_010403 [Pythium oligandrum]|eukprot:TMW55521.1 hypothetical protein Poli38472_010403 [Pythium oligandrum]
MLGGKRKFTENPLTAKAETGSLKIKILRKEGAAGTTENALGVPRSPPRGRPAVAAPQAPSAPVSPPKPRPNRKHVPIFYQQASVSVTSSTDEVSRGQSQFSSDYDAGYSVSSTSSTTNQMERLQLDQPGVEYGTSAPALNPLFSQANTDSNGALSELLRHAFPTVAQIQPFQHHAQPYTTSSSSPSSALLMGTEPEALDPVQEHPASALHQLATSSTTYSSLSRESSTSSTNDHESSSYRFDPMRALQSAIKLATAKSSSSLPSFSYQNQQTMPSHIYGGSDQYSSIHSQPTTDDHDLGPPPMAAPAFGVQHSLMGGGIESQPVIANVNTRNFDWNRHQEELRAAQANGRPRSGSLPNVLAEDDEETNEHGHPNVHMWKEV